MLVVARRLRHHPIQRRPSLTPPRYASASTSPRPSFSPLGAEVYPVACKAKSTEQIEEAHRAIDEAARLIGHDPSPASLAQQVADLRRDMNEGFKVLLPTRLAIIGQVVTQTFVEAIRMLWLNERSESVAAWQQEHVETRSCLLALYWKEKAADKKRQMEKLGQIGDDMKGLEEALEAVRSGRWVQDGKFLGIVSMDKVQIAVKGLVEMNRNDRALRNQLVHSATLGEVAEFLMVYDTSLERSKKRGNPGNLYRRNRQKLDGLATMFEVLAGVPYNDEAGVDIVSHHELMNFASPCTP
ncbi:hypothetical protein MNV49_001363 [Pseudohyphozyma bogoriensis]|nr:hypothetical protein MNV49_001363 [Pseudohyphozyma bogoriensis]